MNLPGIAQINIELTANCEKRTKCFMCGHTEFHKPESNMPFDLLESLVPQLPVGIIVSLHRNGDTLDYPQLGEALSLLAPFITSVVTHGERLAEKADQIICKCTTVTVSVIQNDPDREIQLESVREFLRRKGDLSPMFQFKFVGNVENTEAYEALNVPIIGRSLHRRSVNQNYQNQPPIPEVRVCLDLLSKPSISWDGKVYACNRLDVADAGVIGDLRKNTLAEILNGPIRMEMIKHHLAGRRDLANSLCKSCRYWGIPVDF